MGSPLFRKEMLDARREEWLGSVLVTTSLYGWIWAVASLVVILSISALVFLSHYTKRVTYSGVLSPIAGIVAVTAPNDGVIDDLSVHIGDKVFAGERLFTVSSEQNTSKFGRTHTFLASQLQLQQQKLEANLAEQQQTFSYKRADATGRVALLSEKLAQINNQLGLQNEKISNAEAFLRKIKPLASQGYISALQIQEQQNAIIDSQSQAKSLARDQIDAKAALAAAKAELAQLPLDEAITTNDINRQLANLKQSEASNELARALVAQATTSGIVATVSAASGQVASRGQTVLTIIPEDAKLEAKVLVPSRDVGFIKPGDRAILRYAPYPYQEFGEQYGRVKNVTKSSLTAGEIYKNTDDQKDHNYLVEIALDKQGIAVFGAHQTLSPGTALEADIIVGKRRMIEWILGPLYRAEQERSPK
jgi:membrane fusion protein